MDPHSTTVQATLEDRVFVLEMALTSIGGALLAPTGWGDSTQLHQEMYATVRRVLRGSEFLPVLESREAQLAARDAKPAQAATDAVLDTLRSQVADSGQRVPGAPVPGSPRMDPYDPAAPSAS
jgi:hypothetical protein